MRRIPLLPIAALLLLAAALPVAAQDADSVPRLPAAPVPRAGVGASALPAGPLGVFGSQDTLVTSSANDHGSYLWIVGPAAHIVTLCEKGDAAKDFVCTTKRLP